jgi:hypothetical protein
VNWVIGLGVFTARHVLLLHDRSLDSHDPTDRQFYVTQFAFSTAPFEVLNFLFMLFRGGAGFECPQIAAFACLGILFSNTADIRPKSVCGSWRASSNTSFQKRLLISI